MYKSIVKIATPILSIRHCKKLISSVPKNGSSAIALENNCSTPVNAMNTELSIQDKKLTTLRSNNDIHDLLHPLVMDCKKMTQEKQMPENIGQLVTKLSFALKCNAKRTLRKDKVSLVLNNPSFQFLLNVTMDNLKYLPAHKIPVLLMILDDFHIAETSAIVQKTLQLLRCNMNDMRPEQLSLVLSIIHGRYDTTLLGRAVFIGVRALLKHKIQMYTDWQDLDEAVRLFKQLSVLPLENDFPYLVKTLYRHRNQFSLSQAMDVYYGLCHLSNPTTVHFTIQKVIEDHFYKAMKSFDKSHILRILSDLRTNAKLGNSTMYTSRFLDNIIERVISMEPDVLFFKDVTYSLIRLCHVSESYIKFIESYWAEERNVFFTESSQYDFAETCMFYFSMANHQSPYLNDIKHIILNHLPTEMQIKKCLWLALNLLRFDCFHKDLIAKCFVTEIRDPQSAKHQLYLIQIVETLYPEVELWPSPSVIDTATCVTNTYKKLDQTRSRQILQRILGNSTFFLENLETSAKCRIDYTFLLDEQRALMRFTDTPTSNQEIDNVEELLIPPKYQPVLVLVLENYSFHANGNSLTGIYTTWIKCIEIQTGLPVATLNKKYLDELTKEELELRIQEAATNFE